MQRKLLFMCFSTLHTFISVATSFLILYQLCKIKSSNKKHTCKIYKYVLILIFLLRQTCYHNITLDKLIHLIMQFGTLTYLVVLTSTCRCASHPIVGQHAISLDMAKCYGKCICSVIWTWNILKPKY